MTIAKAQEELMNPPKAKEIKSSTKPKQESNNSQKPLSQLLNRVILFGAGAGLLALGISLTLNRVTSVTATKAFVNGKIITVTSPIDGQVQAKTKLDSGMPVTMKQLLLKVKEPVAKSDSLQTLKVDLVAEKAKLEAVEAKSKELAQLNQFTQPNLNYPSQNLKPLEEESNKAQEVALSQINSDTAQIPDKVAVRLAEQNVKQSEIELKVAQNHAKVAQSKYEKFRYLANQGAISTFSVEEVLNNWKVSLEQVEAAKVRLETANVHLTERERLQRVASQSNFKEVSIKTSSQKAIPENLNPENLNRENLNRENLNPELAEFQRRKTELQVSIEAKEKAITELEKSSKKQKDYQILASSKGTLWEVMVQDGEQIRSGQPLLKQLNCQKLWVDAFVNLDDLKRIQIGSPAQVEIYTNNLKLNGKVKTIRSSLSGEPKLGQDVAVNPPDTKNQQLAQVRIELQNSQELGQSLQNSAQFCQVGQIAKVNIGQENSLFANLLPW
jgi:multidrug resistance efflux pump